MGVSSSSEKTRQQKDIAHLGDRMPFGDAELLQVYRVYQELQEKLRCNDSTTTKDENNSNTSNNSSSGENQRKTTSFLKDVAILSAAEGLRSEAKKKKTSPMVTPEEEKQQKQEEATFLEERLYLLEAIERKILPAGFGNTLYRTCFLGPRDVSEYDDEHTTTTTNQRTQDDGDEDEDSRMTRLEKFFEGLSNGTRRDRKTVTRCLIQCCTQHPPPLDETVNGNDNNAAVTDFAYGGANANHFNNNQSEKIYTDPMELVDLGYRVCIAAAFLKEATGGNEDEDVGRFLPPTDPRELTPGLRALSNSLASLAIKRKQRRLRSTTPSGELAKLVDEDDIFEWVEQVAPMYGSILPTFLHCIFFPFKAAPPTRSSFDYPRISQESTVFPMNSTPLLFSFGCMSPSLGGEVRVQYAALILFVLVIGIVLVLVQSLEWLNSTI